MSLPRRWRWVTRDKGTDYEDTVSIWTGACRPKSDRWDGFKFTGQAEDGVFDYNQGQGQSIDISWVEFRHVFNCTVQPGDVIKVEFSLEVQT